MAREHQRRQIDGTSWGQLIQINRGNYDQPALRAQLPPWVRAPSASMLRHPRRQNQPQRSINAEKLSSPHACPAELPAFDRAAPA